MKKFLIIAIILIMATAIFIVFVIPVKKAVKLENLSTNDTFIIVKEYKVTLAPWLAVGDNKGLYDTPIYVHLKGTVPSGFNFAVEYADNLFICYGSFVGKGELGGEEYSIFQAEDWDILYPIKRDSIIDFILPNSHLCKYDTIKP